MSKNCHKCKHHKKIDYLIDTFYCDIFKQVILFNKSKMKCNDFESIKIKQKHNCINLNRKSLSEIRSEIYNQYIKDKYECVDIFDADKESIIQLSNKYNFQYKLCENIVFIKSFVDEWFFVINKQNKIVLYHKNTRNVHYHKQGEYISLEGLFENLDGHDRYKLKSRL